ncbi:hypothetical protein SCAR479_08955 [Seiridium cardinale]|uniref:Uncharacterized protein n=1 Tax=Seiridium cardinale TaxID=138064 RepID=A0ABR2XKZ1_9PEZI
MPAFFAKRGTTMPPNIRDDHSDDFSHGSTLKMDISDGDTSTRKRNKRPGTSMIVSIVLLVLLVGVSVAAGICYLNHMHTVDDINHWVDEGRVSPSSATSRALDGLQKRQQYGYGNPPSSNVTTSAPATILSTTMSNGTATTASTSDVFSETAPGIPITVTPFWPSVGSTITQTITSNINYTVSPSVQSSLVHESVTVTVGVNNTLTLSAPTLLSSLTETVSVTSTGAVTETPSSGDHLTVTRTTLQPITVSVPNNTTSVEESTLSQVTVTVSGTVFPLPTSSITTATAAGVTGAPPAWTSNNSGWNSTISSGFEGPTGTVGTVSVTKTLGTVSVTVTTVVSVSTSCSEVPGSTATSNDAITASVPQSASSSTLITSSLATVEPSVTPSKGSITSTTTCTETLTPTPISQSAASSSALFYTTETETQLISGKTKTVTVTTEVTKSTTASMPGGYSAQADTTTLAGTTTIVSTSYVQVTTTATRDPELSSTASICVLAPTVTVTVSTVHTVTVVSDSNQITVKDVSSMMSSSLASSSASASSNQITSISGIPLISISPNTTVIVSAPDRKTLSVITKTITSDMTTVSVDAISVSASSSTSAFTSSSNMMSHSVSDLNTSHTTATFSTTQYYSLPTGGNISMYATGTPAGTIYSTKTVMGNHTSTGVPIVPVTSAGSKRRAGPFGGHGGQSNMPCGGSTGCVILLIGILSLLV